MNQDKTGYVDSAWEHGEKIYKGGNLYAKCIYCGHLVQGITRLKYHLAQVKGIVKVCPSAPNSVSQGFMANFENDPAGGIMKLKDVQISVPRVEQGHGGDAHSADEPTPSEPLEMRIQMKEAEVHMIRSSVHKAEAELAELKKKHSQ